MEQHTTPESTSQLDNLFNISFDSEALDHLKRMAKWARICALCAFIGYVIAIVRGLYGHRASYGSAELAGGGFFRLANSGNLASALVTAVIGGIINYFLYKFADSVSKGVQRLETNTMNQGFDHLRIYFKIYGIILIIVLSLVAIFLLIFLLVAAFAGGGH